MKCIICQRNCDEEVDIFTHNSKSSFLSSDEICNTFIDDHIQAGDIQMAYHRSRTLANTTLLSISAENVVQRSPIRTVVPLLF